MCVCEGMCIGVQGVCWGQEEGGVMGGWVKKCSWWVVAKVDGCLHCLTES